MKKKIYEWLFFKIMGWRVAGSLDLEIKKCVFMIMPHTSSYDFFLGIFARGVTGLQINWVGKKELFSFPLGFYFRYMGGEPLDRTGGLNKVDAIAEIFKQKEVFRLGIAPEGTRKKVDELKTGFYYIALKANVPIIPVAFDYGKKEINFGQPFLSSGDLEADLIILKKHFKGVEGKIPENQYEV